MDILIRFTAQLGKAALGSGRHMKERRQACRSWEVALALARAGAQAGAQAGAAPILAGPTPHSWPTASRGNSTWWWSFSLPRKPK